MNEITSATAWQSIDAAGEERKDGRDVLLWQDGHPVVGSWCDGWRDPVGREVVGATHLADVEGPGGEPCPGR